MKKNCLHICRFSTPKGNTNGIFEKKSYETTKKTLCILCSGSLKFTFLLFYNMF